MEGKHFLEASLCLGAFCGVRPLLETVGDRWSRGTGPRLNLSQAGRRGGIGDLV
jgi:hypothetical protein